MRALVLLGLIILLGACATPAPTAASDQVTIATARAQATWDSLVQHLSVPYQPGLFFEDLQTGQLAYVWPHSQILHAALDLALLTQDESSFDQTVQGLAQYKLVNAYTAYAPVIDPSQNESRFWDDNGWIGLALMQATYQTTNPQHHLSLVNEIWSFLQSGQASDGGVYWHEGDPQHNRGVPATGSTTELALRLYLATGESESKYLTFAQRNDSWLNTHLHAPEGYFWDSWYENPADNPESPGQNVNRWMFTYNQGVPIGSDVLFYRVTGDSQYLTHAKRTADAALDYFSAERLWTQPPPFNAIFFRNLLALDRYAPDPRYRLALEAYLDRVWNEARDPKTGLFTEGGIGTYDRTFGSIDQAAFVQMFALLAWPLDRLQDLT